MNNPFTINVHIDLGLSPALQSLLSTIIQEKQVSEPEEKESPEKPMEKVQESKPKKVTAKVEKKEGPKPVEPEQPVEVEQAEEKAETEVEHEYTEADVRAAMARTRERIEGADYKEKTDSEGYKQWHRALTSWFKLTAGLYGAEKPSALADSESRRRFIEECDDVTIVDGSLERKLPF